MKVKKNCNRYSFMKKSYTFLLDLNKKGLRPYSHFKIKNDCIFLWNNMINTFVYSLWNELLMGACIRNKCVWQCFVISHSFRIIILSCCIAFFKYFLMCIIFFPKKTIRSDYKRISNIPKNIACGYVCL